MDQPQGRMTHNISLTAIESQALLWLVRRRFGLRTSDPLPRGVISWLMQEWIDERMRSEIGRDWQVVLSADGPLEAVPA